ncbi:P-II family nitrogen regulator [Methanothrix sp.]
MNIVEQSARTECIGDGRIFMTPIEQAHKIRMGEKVL